ncbi:MAG: ABC transporter permease [Syntrophomonas sp.]
MRFLKGLLIPFVILAIWYTGSKSGIWNSFILPSPGQTFETGQYLITSGILFKHVLISLYRVFAGFALAFLLAFPLGIILGMKRKLIDYFELIIEFVHHVPPLATVPMLILWFGIGEISKLVVIVLASFFPIFLNTLDGVLRCDEHLLEVGESFGFAARDRFKYIIFPATFPYILMGMRLGLGYSWRALIGAEIIAATAGIGYMILDAELLSRPDIMIVGILTIGILGTLIDFVFFRITNLFVTWKEGEKTQNGWG